MGGFALTGAKGGAAGKLPGGESTSRSYFSQRSLERGRVQRRWVTKLLVAATSLHISSLSTRVNHFPKKYFRCGLEGEAMKFFWRCMKEAAYARHTMLVTCFYGHDEGTWRKEMVRHYRFVDSVYALVLPQNEATPITVSWHWRRGQSS